MEKGDHDALLKIINPLMTDDLTKIYLSKLPKPKPYTLRTKIIPTYR